MQSPRTTGYRTTRDEVKQTLTVPYLVSGSQTLTLTVQRKDLSDTARGAAGVGAAGVTTTTTTSTSSAPAASSALLPADDGDTLAFQSLALVTNAPEPTPARSSPSLPKREGNEAEGTAPAEAAAAPAASSSTPTVKPVGRLPSVWRQTSQADFAAGTLANVAVSSLGDVRLSPSLTKAAETGENYVWAVQPDGHGGAYFATGDSGVVYKRSSDGKVSPFFRTGELEATCLSLDDAGNLYVGTAPNGFVFRVAPDGKGAKVFTAKEKYITALAQSKSAVYVATGGGTGRIYQIGSEAPVFTSPETHILSLATGKDGILYAGSSPSGIVYKITPDGKTSVLYDAAEPNVPALTTDSLGNVYAGTSAAGNVYKIAPDGTAKKLAGLPSAAVTSLKTDNADTVYAASGGTITKIAPDNSVQTYTTPADPQFISLAVDPQAQTLYAGTGTGGSVYTLGAAGSGTAEGTFQSAVHDAGRRAQWGTLAWQADTPDGSRITLQTRSGDVARPDSSWSAWSVPYTQPRGETVTSPPARFLQYQARFTGAAPKLSAVAVYYLPRNQVPTVSLAKPAAGDAVSKTTTLNWTASDPDKDTLSYDVSYSADGGKTWKPITASAQLRSQTKTKTVTKQRTRRRPPSAPSKAPRRPCRRSSKRRLPPIRRRPMRPKRRSPRRI